MNANLLLMAASTIEDSKLFFLVGPLAHNCPVLDVLK